MQTRDTEPTMTAALTHHTPLPTPTPSSSIDNVTKSTARPHPSRRRVTCALLLLVTVPIGLTVRFLPLHLPWFLYKYLGSTLWAVALYWFLAALLPKLRPQSIAIIAITIATLVELSRLIPIAPIDAFRQTLAGTILLGRYFSLKNIVAYILAITLVAALDSSSHFGRQNPDIPSV